MNSKRCMGFNLSWFTIVLLLGIVIGMAGCGGGGGGGDSSIVPTNPASSVYVEGTAAAGAPVVGTINIRGADGTVSLSAIEADGSFQVNVTALTAPFTIWVQGSANGKEVTLYSTIADPGQVNVTPVTHAIMALALGADPVDYFGDDPDAALPSAEAITQAKAAILSILDGLFSTVGLTDGFDLMNGEFTADGTGFDQLLDALNLPVADDGGVSIVDKISGVVLAQTEDGQLTQNMEDGDLVEIVEESMTDLGQMRAIFEKIAALYAINPNPGITDLTNTVRPLMADDFLDSGSRPDDELEAWADPTNEKGPPGPFTVEGISIHRQMITRSALNEYGAHREGAWAVVRIGLGDRVEQLFTGFVRDDGGNWLWYGNQCPFLDSGNVDAYAVRSAHADGTVDYDSGLDFYLDDEGNQAQLNFGITMVLVTNSALPEIQVPPTNPTVTLNGLIMARGDIVTEYDIVYPAGIINYGANKYMESDGLDVGAITDAEFRYVGLTSSGDIAHVWVDLLHGKPIATSVLNANPGQYFATITAVAGKDPGDEFYASDFNIGTGTVAVSWQLPVNDVLDLVLDDITLGWYGSSDYGWFSIDGEQTDQTSCVFDTSDLPAPGTLYSTWVHVETEDEFDRDFDSSRDWYISTE